MSQYIRNTDTGPDCNLYVISDTHMGSIGFHETAFDDAVKMITADPIGKVAFAGDAVEAKLIDSKHFNPDGLRPNQLDCHKQADYFIEKWRPLASQTVLLMPGNHDSYLAPNFYLLRYISRMLGLESVTGLEQTWLNIFGLTLHFLHPLLSTPQGAKDWVQKRGNQLAWMKNKLEHLAGSVSAHYLAHIHKCMILPPREFYTLLDSGADVKGRSFVMPPVYINGEKFVHPDSRWYVATGTFRRNAGMGYTDYCELKAYPPQPIEFTVTKIRDSQIETIEKVLLS